MKRKIVKVKPAVKRRKETKKISAMSVDDFMNTIGDDSSAPGTDSEEDERDSRTQKMGKSSQAPNGNEYGKHKVPRKFVELKDTDEDEEAVESSADEGEENHGDTRAGHDENEDSDGDAPSKKAGKEHKRSLSNLKDIDPQFYQYLQENDKKLLQFDVTDSDETDDEKEDDASQKGSKSDRDSEEGDGKGKQSSAVTLKMVKCWREKLSADITVQSINDAIQAFHAALQRVVPESERDVCPYKVDGGAVFNAVVQMCILDLLPAIRKYLKLPSKSWSHTQLTKNKHWVKLRSLVKSYIVDLLQLIDGVASENVTTILLKHLHQMCPFVPCFPNVSKKLLKKMVLLWSTGEETVRVLAFMCLLKVTTSQQQTLLDATLRHMYMAYINNTKFVSPSTLPGINFMRKSLAEMFLLDENVSYHHAFLYIRQLAIHLRNAITLHKKESIQAVYNWQFIASLALWVELLSSSNRPALRPLLYPVVQVLVGTLKLVPTAQYFPLRFQCIRLLIKISRNTGTFVPTLPFILEVLNSFNFNKKHTKVSMKPLDISCILRVSKVQRQENGFKDTVIESVYGLLLDYSASVSHSIAFPDLMIPARVQLKTFLKTCKVANYTKKIRQILDKIEANSKFIEKERKGADINLSNANVVENWETSMKVKGTPLMSFYSSWEKMNSLKETKQKVDHVDLSGPKIKAKGAKKLTHSKMNDNSASEDTDSEDEPLSHAQNQAKGVKKAEKGGEKKKLKVNTRTDAHNSDESEELDDQIEDVSLADW